MYFNPRGPRGTATFLFLIKLVVPQYFNPRGPRGTATSLRVRHTLCRRISIHAAREGPRLSTYQFVMPALSNFNPRGPRGTATVRGNELQRIGAHFNPRGPRGTATLPFDIGDQQSVISIHAAREGPRHYIDDLKALLRAISIHAAREGPRPQNSRTSLRLSPVFQSTRPARDRDALRV